MDGAIAFAVFLFIAVVIFLLAKNKAEIKKVNTRNRLIVVGTLVALLLFSSLAIYYAGNWIAGYINNGALKMTFQIVWIITIFGFITKIWDSVLSKVKRESGIV
jgi:multisubunit Na+/H+ antiporter MnhB subunit